MTQGRPISKRLHRQLSALARFAVAAAPGEGLEVGGHQVRIRTLATSQHSATYAVSFGASGQAVALKVGLTSYGARCIKRESQFVKELGGDMVARYIASSEGPQPFLCTELVGGSRASLRRLAPSRLPWLATQLCGVLALMTDRDVPIVHRDIKPPNVLLTDSRLVLLDFGSAEREGARRTRPFTGPLPAPEPGRRQFQPPEALVCDPTQDRGVDVFSASAMLFVAIIGAVPYACRVCEPQAMVRSYQRQERGVYRSMGHLPRPLRHSLMDGLRADHRVRARDLSAIARAITARF